jgi:antitoxin component YwqK of YwqJK toxin-antitoxin module
MEIKGGSLSATYNENGKLISVENYKNVNFQVM